MERPWGLRKHRSPSSGLFAVSVAAKWRVASAAAAFRPPAGGRRVADPDAEHEAHLRSTQRGATSTCVHHVLARSNAESHKYRNIPPVFRAQMLT